MLLIVHHTPSPHCQEMFEAVVAGATDLPPGGRAFHYRAIEDRGT
jgi:hypothetical protein